MFYRVVTAAMLVCVAALAVSSCETLSYKEPDPATTSVARVRFVTTTETPAILRAYDDRACEQNEVEWMRLEKSNLMLNTHPKSLGMPLWHYDLNAAKEVYVTADRELNAMFFSSEIDGTMLYKCATPFFFKFAQGRSYEVTFDWDRSYCSVSVSELVQSGQNWSRTPLAHFDNRVTDANRGCLTRFEQQRLY